MTCSQETSAPSAPGAGDALTRLCVEVLPIWLRQIAQARTQSETACSDMLAAFAPLVPLMDRLAAAQARVIPTGAAPEAPPAQPETHELNSLLSALQAPLQAWGDCRERLFVSIQYQDRINQMLQLLQDDVSRLDAALQSGTAPESLEVKPWLQRLEQAYAMNEQREAHHIESNTSPSADNDIDYF
jgi:hypothetical protein